MLKNFIFDFGNVLGIFNFDDLMKACGSASTRNLHDMIFYDWDRLDAGLIEYEDYIEQCLKLAPDEEKENILAFFHQWYRLLPPIDEIHEWIHELKKQGYRIYLCSNAPVIFEEHAASIYPILKEFDGIVFSGSIQLAKPQPEIYSHLLDKFQLVAEECFFIDDREENIEAGKQCGIDGMVYSHNLNEIKNYIKSKKV